MKKRTVLASSMMVGVLAFGSFAFAAPPQAAAAQTPAPQHSWTMEQAITSSVHEAWILGGRNEQGFFQIVRALAQLSAEKRGITLPDNKEAGIRAGNWIKKQAKKDPNQLLYVIVDRAVQYTAAHEKNAAAQQ